MRALIEKIILAPSAVLAVTSGQELEPTFDDGVMRSSVHAGERNTLHALFVTKGLLAYSSAQAS